MRSLVRVRGGPLKWLGTHRHAKREGQADARLGIGKGWSRQTPSFEGFGSLSNLAQALLGTRYYNERSKLDPKRQAAYVTLVQCRRQMPKAKKEADQARERVKEVTAKEPAPHLSRLAYVAFLFIVLLADFPVTASAFESLPLYVWETRALAFGVNAGLLGLAHVVGELYAKSRRLRTEADRDHERHLATAAAVALALSVLGIGVVRGYFLLSAGEDPFLKIRVNAFIILAYIIIQLGIVTVAAFMSYLAYEVPEVRTAKRELRKAEGEFKQAENNESAAERNLAQIETEIGLLETRYQEAAAANLSWHDYLRHEHRSARVRGMPDDEPTEDNLGPEPEPLRPGAWTMRTWPFHTFIDQIGRDPMVAPPESSASPNGQRLDPVDGKET